MPIGGAASGGVHAPPPIVLPTIALALPPTPALPLPSGPVSDTVGPALQQMAAGAVSRFIADIQTSHPPADPVAVANLLHAAATAVLAGNAPAAPAALTELIHRSPEHVETLAGESSLAPIRVQVQDLLTRVTTTAKVEAETRLATAAQAVESAKPHSERPGDWSPREILPVAAQLIDSGRHANVLLATDMSQAVINFYGGIEVASPRTLYQRLRMDSDSAASRSMQAPWTQAVAVVYAGVTGSLKKMWRVSPLLILLFIWAVLGVIAAIAAGIELWSVELSLEVWGAGSAGLLGYGTYKRLRG